FFWVARMMMMGCYLTGTEPFHTIYLHGLVRDEHGRKMSKSYGNVVNPLEVMDAQGTDALRFTLATSGTPGQDLNLNPQRIEAARNFANKIWNITRFVLSKGVRVQDAATPLQHLTLADRQILSRYNRLCLDANRLMEGYNFGEAGRQMQDFLWSEFADWYVEIAKVQLEGDAARQATTRAVLYHVLEGTLRLLHPYIPFVTEEVWQYLTRVEGVEPGPAHSLMLATYPVGDEAWLDAAAESDWALSQELIVAIRNIRSEYKVEPAKWVPATVVAGGLAPMLREQAALIARLARVDAARLTMVESLEVKPTQSAAIVLGAIEAYLPLAGLIDLEAERARLRKDLEQAEADVVRREAKLANQGFVGKAPANVVQRERDSLETARAALATLRERLAEL
ncbi:MAG: class I tRNA ligase family protein, partial [Oscillochloris sp.]|nr:class I tRNA ligase family protein [Oscillochloris sp.]